MELWETTGGSLVTARETDFGTFRLDYSTDPQPTSRLASLDAPANVLDESFASTRPLRILVVDDNDINRKVIRVILQKLGYRCDEAVDGSDALSRYLQGAYDCIFMDLDMPEMDGIEATEAIRALETEDTREVEIIAVTANVSEETRLRCRRAGMNGYLEKPITAAIIKDQILRSWPRMRTRRGK